MIIVTVQFTDGNGAPAYYNGGFGVHFYNLNEAKLFAENESERFPGSAPYSHALCKVYNNGQIVQVWEDGVDITP